MPRPKLYKTREEKRLADCAKAQRYYSKNADQINTEKRKRRQRATQEAETQGNSSSLLAIHDIHNRFLVLTGNSPINYLDRLYVDYQAWLIQVEPDMPSPLELNKPSLDDLLTDIEKRSEEVLNLFGCGNEYRTAAGVKGTIREFILCIDDFELAHLEGRLSVSYTQKQLRFQDQIVMGKLSRRASSM
ncbi:hypothetical protein K435DRAFT_861208 [Dendrothele bispora CBS 962.96]|uniref:Uncharacterized protein n=1 Tax=Dendrothele bispora (strain CBS 962.96) TaxID=1314807 RepID=A0A4V4HF66_DENBC|nr:hypothetical protein K435DRAFT_861208 [Dendrothele bispora CBS 962.96]